MTSHVPPTPEVGPVRLPSVAGFFYPADAVRLRSMAERLLADAARIKSPAGSHGHQQLPVGLLVPHAGLTYSGVIAAAAWRLLGAAGLGAAETRPTVVILGTNHRAGWLDGVGVWDDGAWGTPLGDVVVDTPLASAILGLGPPFAANRKAHLGEHSVEVQLPLLRLVSPSAQIVPLAVSAGTGPEAIEAGERLGQLLAQRRASGGRIVVAISSDMAHYPAHEDGMAATTRLLPAILDADPVAIARRERALLRSSGPDLLCGMCGIQPTVLGLAALRTLGTAGGEVLACASSADAGGPIDRTVGYLAVAFGPS